MDNFDKLNAEFGGPKAGGFKYWFWLVWSYIFAVLGIALGIYAAMPSHNSYLALLTLLCGAFGFQTAAWAKGEGERTKPITISMVLGGICVVFACVVLYIILPYLS